MNTFVSITMRGTTVGIIYNTKPCWQPCWPNDGLGCVLGSLRVELDDLSGVSIGALPAVSDSIRDRRGVAYHRREFAAHWFETGTPAFLVDLLLERRVASVALDRMVGTTELLSTFDVGDIGTEALLFHTGYLTITGEEELGGQSLYRLGYPNRAVGYSTSNFND